MKYKSLVILVLFFLSGCVAKSELDDANKKIAELEAQVTSSMAEVEKIKALTASAEAETARLKMESEAEKLKNERLESQNSSLQNKVNEKPALPVTVSFRRAMTGPGNVAILNTTVKSIVPVLITVHSAALGTSKTFERHLDPSHPTTLGHLEGAVIENGDSITIENLNYSLVSVTVSL